MPMVRLVDTFYQKYTTEFKGLLDLGDYFAI